MYLLFKSTILEQTLHVFEDYIHQDQTACPVQADKTIQYCLIYVKMF